MKKKTELKRKISEAATARFVKNRFFTIQSLAEEVKISEKEICNLFSSRSSILYYYYVSRMHLYSEHRNNIEGYNQFTLSEKLGNLFLTLLDFFEEHSAFVDLTYREYVIQSKQHSFKSMFIEELRDIFSNDSHISGPGTAMVSLHLFNFIYLQFHGLILFWLNDDSTHRENSLALVDKWCALTEELFYSKIADKSFDLLKFLTYQSPLKKLNRHCMNPVQTK